ncbi:PEP-CTERM sorting domain-containing protein [Kiritimatiellaeota bacterium B1221]|nr:PEP-CTERM sorting domain-containing protein [Kiritimatiellaeota bacterium B1221]
MKHPHFLLKATALLAVMSLSNGLQAQLAYSTTWEGDTDTNMNNNNNWDNAGGVGRDVAVIFDDPGAVTYQPDVPAGAPNNRAEVNAIVFNQAGWNITTDAATSTHIALWNSGVTPYIISNGAGTNRIGGIRIISETTTITTGTGNTLLIDDDYVGEFDVASKSGDGTLIINTDMGRFLDVNAGTFIFNGTMYNHGSTGHTIASGAVLGGTGIFQENNSDTYTFNSGATLAPGALGIGDSSAGTLTFENTRVGATRNFNINLEAGSTLAVDIFGDGSSDTVAFGGASDGTDMNFNINTSAILALSGAAAYNTAYTVASFTGPGNYTGTFGSVTLNGGALVEDTDYTISYDPGSIQVTLIPEPSSLMLIAGAFGLLAFLSRHKKVEFFLDAAGG